MIIRSSCSAQFRHDVCHLAFGSLLINLTHHTATLHRICGGVCWLYLIICQPHAGIPNTSAGEYSGLRHLIQHIVYFWCGWMWYSVRKERWHNTFSCWGDGICFVPEKVQLVYKALKVQWSFKGSVSLYWKHVTVVCSLSVRQNLHKYTVSDPFRNPSWNSLHTCQLLKHTKYAFYLLSLITGHEKVKAGFYILNTKLGQTNVKDWYVTNIFSWCNLNCGCDQIIVGWFWNVIGIENGDSPCQGFWEGSFIPFKVQLCTLDNTCDGK